MSEVIAVPVSPSPPATPSSVTGAKRFEGEGLPFKAKLIGMEDLSVDRDEKVCLESMFKLKAVAKARGEHKQRIQLNLTMSAVKVTDDITKTLIANHEIERISFVVLDPRDTRAFGYIYNTSDDRHQFWAIKTEKSAAITVLAMKDLFELAFEKFTTDQNGSPAEPTPTATPVAVPEPPKPTEIVNLPPPVEQPPVPVAPVAPVAPAVPQPEPVILLMDAWDDLPPVVPPPPPPKDVSASLFDDLNDLVLGPVSVPAPLPKAEDPWDDFMKPTASTAPVANATPVFPPASTLSIFTPPPAPIPSPIATPMANLPTSPVSPIAPPTVTNPLLDFDLFGSAPAGRVTKDQFFPQQQKQTIGQLQTDRQA